MAEQENTSPTTGLTPAPGTSLKDTPASDGLKPQKTALTLEEALQKLSNYEHEVQLARGAEDRLGKKLTAYEKAEKEALEAKRLADEAQLSEIERTKKQFSELQSQHNEYVYKMQDRIVRYEIEAQASRLGIIDPEAASALLNKSSLEYSEDGTPNNTEKLLKDLIKNKPYLAPAKQEETTTPAQTANQQRPPLTPAMNPGRSSISTPATLPPGQVTQLHQLDWKRR